jgi:2-polyprenyl-6-methoxyphenol hydroxylase-like FAD-dependent oxidoreductase
MTAHTPILIVGAGPTGLNLANLLAQYGIPYRLIDKNTQCTRTSNALAVQSRSLEMWDQMGIVDYALTRGKKIMGLSINNKQKQIACIRFQDVKLPTEYPFILGLPQSDTEQLLIQQLSHLGVSVERGTTLIDFINNEHGVTAQLQKANGEAEIVSCDWLIAADGCHSMIRKKLNLEFQGSSIAEKFIMMDAELEHDFDPDYFHAILAPAGALVFAPLPHFTRIICSVSNDTGITDFTQPTLQDFEYVIRERSPYPVRITKSTWISHFITHHRLINKYQQGKILFAGDSAHIHSPVGGQGMNTGMQDTFNLAWKLAQVIKGKSHASLIETYTRERRPVAERVISSTTKMMHIVTLKNPILVWLRNHFMHIALKFKTIRFAMLFNLSQLAIHYKQNKIIQNNGKRAAYVTVFDKHHNAIAIRHLFKGWQYKLFIFTGKQMAEQLSPDILAIYQWALTETKDVIQPIIITDRENLVHDSLIYIDPSFSAHQAYQLEDAGMCMVRPDGYINLTHNKIDAYALTLLKKFLQQLNNPNLT